MEAGCIESLTFGAVSINDGMGIRRLRNGGVYQKRDVEDYVWIMAIGHYAFIYSNNVE